MHPVVSEEPPRVGPASARMADASGASVSAPATTGISVIVGAYNEAATVRETVHEITGVLEQLPGDHEVIIVDDGSVDGTEHIADELARALPIVRVIHHGTNRGLGGAYTTGWAAASRELVTFFPADGQFPAELIQRLAAAMPDADFALGYLPDRRDGVTARLVSALERALYGVLFGGFPRFQGVFMVRSAVLREIPLRSPGGRGWAVVMELILKGYRGGYRLKSVATTMRPRVAGTSKVNNARTILANTRQVLQLRRIL